MTVARANTKAPHYDERSPLTPPWSQKERERPKPFSVSSSEDEPCLQTSVGEKTRRSYLRRVTMAVTATITVASEGNIVTSTPLKRRAASALPCSV